MRLTRPLLTLAFALAGAYGVSRLVESTLFVALVGDVATPDVAGPVSRVFAGTAMTMLVFSHCWRATLRAVRVSVSTRDGGDG
mgnify:CR=1 FL=1